MSTAAYRQRAERSLRDSLTRERPAGVVSDGKGGRIPGTPSMASYACAVISTTGGRQEDADLIRTRGAWIIKVSTAADIKEGDTLTLLGRTLKVRFAPPASATQLLWIIRAEETRPE